MNLFFFSQPFGITVQVLYVKAASLRGPGQTKKFTIHDRPVFHSRITVFSRRAAPGPGRHPSRVQLPYSLGAPGGQPPLGWGSKFFSEKKISKLSFPDMGLYVNYIDKTSNFYAFCLLSFIVGRRIESLAIRVRPIPNFSSHV